MARRPAAVLRRKPSPGTLSLGVPVAAFVDFAIAPALPELPAGDVSVLVAALNAAAGYLLPNLDRVAAVLDWEVGED